MMEQFIAKYNGKVVGDGQCGTLVRQYWIEVDHTNPPSYPSSKDYWFNPVPGYDKITSNPQPGNIAIYNAHGAFPDGHSAIYVGGQVFEQNADPDGSPAHLFNRANTYLLGYLRKQGGDMSTIGDTEARIIAKWIYGYTNELDIEGAVGGLLGMESNTALRQADASPTAAAYTLYLNDLKKAAASGGNGTYTPVTDQLYKKAS